MELALIFVVMAFRLKMKNVMTEIHKTLMVAAKTACLNLDSHAKAILGNSHNAKLFVVMASKWMKRNVTMVITKAVFLVRLNMDITVKVVTMKILIFVWQHVGMVLKLVKKNATMATNSIQTDAVWIA